MASAHPCPRLQGRLRCRVVSRESWGVSPQTDIIPTLYSTPLPVWSCGFNFLCMPELSQVTPQPEQEPTVEAGVGIRQRHSHYDLGLLDLSGPQFPHRTVEGSLSIITETKRTHQSIHHNTWPSKPAINIRRINSLILALEKRCMNGWIC